MSSNIRTAVVIALLTTFASAAVARPVILSIQPQPGLGGCATDEGQGRFRPCDAGGP
jgi:hypothetical protein